MASEAGKQRTNKRRFDLFKSSTNHLTTFLAYPFAAIRWRYDKHMQLQLTRIRTSPQDYKAHRFTTNRKHLEKNADLFPSL